MREIPRQERDGAVITLFDAKGTPRRTFDFSRLHFGRQLAVTTSRYFAVRYGHLILETQSQAWRAFNDLADAISASNGRALQRLPKDAIARLREALLRQSLKPRVAQARVKASAELIEWCLRNEPGVVEKGAITLVPTLYERRQPEPRPAVSEKLVKQVLAACYEDVEQAEKKLKLGRRLSGEGALPGDGDHAKAIYHFLVATRGKMPLRIDLNHRLQKLADDAGGLRAVTEHVRVTPTQVFPFYLAILAQTGGNPMALRQLRRDCVHPHPLASHLERMVWDKARAGREQYVDFPASKHWSAPSLVRRLADLNGALMKCAHRDDRHFLFLCQASGATEARIPSWANIHLLLDKFIAKHGLPSFDLAGFRSHVAKAHHVQAGSITAAKERLNHGDASTTARYSPLGDRAAEHEQTMVAFQGRLVREARGEQFSWKQDGGVATTGAHETLFGFRCSDPYEGRAQGSVAGKLCLQFQRCATCPGALIPLDDVRVVAKLLATARHLEATGVRAKKEGWWDRYCEVYEPSRQVLFKELLPAVSGAVLAKAEKFVSLETIPHLE